MLASTFSGLGLLHTPTTCRQVALLLLASFAGAAGMLAMLVTQHASTSLQRSVHTPVTHRLLPCAAQADLPANQNQNITSIDPTLQVSSAHCRAPLQLQGADHSGTYPAESHRVRFSSSRRGCLTPVSSGLCGLRSGLPHGLCSPWPGGHGDLAAVCLPPCTSSQPSVHEQRPA